MNMKNVLLFPGQGSQVVSMGYDFAREFSEARAVFEEVDEVLRYNLSSIMFKGPKDELTKTNHVQPALMAVSIAILRVIQEKLGINDISFIADYAAGHSLGEYTALCAAGAISLAETTRLLQIRGTEMNSVVPEGTGGMLAVFIEDEDILEQIITETGGKIAIANYNGAGQFVISAMNDHLDKFVEVAKNHNVNKCIRLKASAPFHSSYMSNVQEVMKEAFRGVHLRQPCVPIISNVSTIPESEPERIKQLLYEQVVAPVRWHESMGYLAKQNVTNYIEIGSSRVLTKLNKRMLVAGTFFNVEKVSDLEDILLFFEKCIEIA